MFPVLGICYAADIMKLSNLNLSDVRWGHLCSCRTELFLLQICFELSKAKSCSASLIPPCGCVISNPFDVFQCSRLPYILAGLTVFFFSPCMSYCLCYISSHLGPCAKMYCMIFSILISGYSYVWSSHHKEYFIAIKWGSKSPVRAEYL